MRYLWVFLILVLTVVSATAQKNDDNEYDENYEFPESKMADMKIDAGIGLGMDYGGIGGRLSFSPTKRLSLFGAIGYNLNGAGYNGGLIYKILPDKRVCPYIIGMYGYNGVIVVETPAGYTPPSGYYYESRTYYGPTFGAGIQLKRGDRDNFWNFGLLVPIRSDQYQTDVDYWQANDPDFGEPFPVAITVGYHFSL